MRYLCFVGLVAVLGALGMVRPAPRQAAPVVGTWLLESIVDTLASDSVGYWMGPHPKGAIIYTASGHVSVQFMRDPRPLTVDNPAAGADLTRSVGTDPFERLEADELRDVVRGYYAYFGRYQYPLQAIRLRISLRRASGPRKSV